MTTRTLLLTLAASVAPLFAQQTALPQPAAQTFTTLATPAAPCSATTEQRLAVFPALALLPQNIAEFAVLTNVGGNLRDLAQSGILPDFYEADIPAELLALDNIALAATAATPATYALLQHALVSLGSVGTSVQLANEWALAARADLRDSLLESLIMHADSLAAMPEGATAGCHLPTSYAILTCQAGEEAMLQECARLVLADLRDSGKAGITPVDDAAGFAGVRINVAETYGAELQSMARNMPSRRREMLLAELAKHPVHLLVRQQGNALILALCEDLQELTLATSPADSLLATDKLAGCDAQLGRRLIACAHMSPELTSALHAANTQPTLDLASGLCATFSRLGEVDAANKPAYDKATSALQFFSAEMQKLTRPISRPSTLLVWADGDLHLALTGDAQGCSYSPGVLRLASMADAPKTSLYAETTPLQLGITPPASQAVLDACFNLAEGFSLTLADDKKHQQAGQVLSIVKAFKPEFQSLAAAGSTIASGLNGQVALVLDSTHAPLPSLAGVAPGLEAETPRFALFAGVCDRSKLAAGWDALLSSAGQVASKLGASPEVVKMLPITSWKKEGSTSYSITLPFFTQDAIPSLAVTDSGVALGSSSNLTLQVANSATGNTPFAGAAYAIRFKPLARTLRSLATALDPCPEEAEPAASSEVRLEKEKNQVAFATIGGENGPTTIFLRTELDFDEIEHPVDGLSTAATIAEFAASVAEGLYMTSTIENGQHVLHLQLRMK